MHSVSVWHRLRFPPWRFLAGRGPWVSLAYVIVSTILGLTLLALLPFTLLFAPLYAVAIGALERSRTRWLGFPPQGNPHVRVPRDRSWLAVRISEVATWREFGAALVDLLLGLVALLLLAVTVASIVLPIAAVIVWRTNPGMTITLFWNVRITYDADTTWLAPLISIAALIVSTYVWAMFSIAQAALLRVLVGPREAELERVVASLTLDRATLVRAIDDERRRIERDLHDGVQQDLVTLRTRLALATLELDALEAQGVDIAALRGTTRDASTDASRAQDALRRTVRGLHPAVLTDHGLPAAVAELATRTPFPVTGYVDDVRPSAETETAAYYLVTEAITNAAKHSTATRGTIRTAWDKDTYVVEFSDNGNGGVNESRGTGIAGLRARAAALDGSFVVQSNTRGTTVTMRIPEARG